MSTPTDVLDVLIVGGGIAGLAAGYELHTRGVPFMLVEAAPRLGGVILTERVDGFTIDGGPDSLLVQKPAAIALCRELGLGDRLMPTEPPRTAFVVRGGRLHPLPGASILGIPTRLAPLLTSSLFSVAGKARMASELFVKPKADRGRDESIGSFMRRRFGREAVEYLAEPLLAGIHAGDVDRLSMRSLFPRLLDAETASGSVIRAFRKLRMDAGGEGAFRSLPGGIGELVHALTAALPSASLRVNTPARALRGAELQPRPSTCGAGLQPCPSTARDGWTVELADGASIRARRVIITAPAFAAADLLRPLDAELADLCAAIPYASTATVAFGYRRDQVPHPLAGSGFVVPRVEGASIMAATWVSSKWAHRAPEGHALLRVFTGGARDPEALERDDAEIIARAKGDLRRLLGITADPLLTRLYRWTRASAQHEVGHLDAVARIERRLERHDGLSLTGSGFRAPGIPDCIADARATAASAAQSMRSCSLT